MNALVTIDVNALLPASVFAPGGVEAILSKIETEVSAEVFTLDTAEGRERIKSVAYKVARSKTALDEMGKELVAGIKAQAGAIDADRRTIRDRLDALKEKVRGPLTAWEEAEADRIALHESALVFLIESARFATPPTVATIRERQQSVRAACERDWQEFSERAEVAAGEAGAALGSMLATAEQAERDAAELAELRKLKAEREEADRIAAQAAHAAEKARQDAEQKAALDAAEAERVAEWHRKREEQAERDVQSAVAAAIEGERRRQEQEAARVAQQKAAEEAAERKRQENKRHREKVQKEIARAINQALNGAQYSPERLVEAIAAGIIPHVSITY